MKILLTGRNGQVGWELERALPPLGEVIATDRETLDLADFDSIRRVVRAVRPDIIVNAAAYTAVDRAESEPALAMRVNGEAPGVLAEEAKRVGARLVHYSTDYVFDGTKGTPYTEDDAPNPLNVYGRTKLAGERAIAAVGDGHLIVRTSWVYAPRGRNFFLTIARKAIAGEALRVVDDQTGAPTTAALIAEVTVELMRADRDASVFNATASGACTWYGFAVAIARHVQPDITVTAIRTGEFPVAARRPPCSVLDNARTAAVLERQLPSWQTLLTRCVAAYRLLAAAS